MSEEKEIVARVIIEHGERETEPIFDSENAYDLKDFISFPFGTESTTLYRGNKIIIEEKEYLIEEISLDMLRPESEVRINNLQVYILVKELEEE